MNRYRSYGELDDQPKTVGDGLFIGVDEYNAPENIRPGNVQKAVKPVGMKNQLELLVYGNIEITLLDGIAIKVLIIQ